jgi:hypothetical protein
MKSRVGLAVSVGLNLGLAGVLGWLWFNPPVAPLPPTDELAVLGGESSNPTNQLQIRYLGRPDFRFPTNGLGRFTWRAIEHTNYFRYVQNLRAIRCPEETIQDIIIADVNERFAARWRERLKRQAAEFKYWQTGDALPGFLDESMQASASELDAERQGLLEDLLGIEVADSVTQFGAVNPAELTLNFLPEDRRQQVIAAQVEFARAQTALLTGGAEGLDASLDQLRDEHQRLLASLMSPEELRRYELTTSPLAMALRSELAGFEPTEEEFGQIYEARKAQEEEVEATRVFLGAQIQAQEAQEAADREAQTREAAMNAALLERLGPERYAQLRQATDPNYELLIQVSRATQFPQGAAARIYEYQQIASVAAERVQANRSLSLEEREIALNAIRAETERTIQNAMGDAAIRLLREWNERQELLLVRPGGGQ